MRNRWVRDDRGFSLPELLVVMVLVGVVAALAISAIAWANRSTTTQVRDANLWADMQDASTQLLRDVNDAQAITVAEPNQLTVQVVRDGKCMERAWAADTAQQWLTVTTTFFEQRECNGPSSTRTDRFVGNNAVGTNDVGTHPTLYVAAQTFTYFDTAADAALPDPVEPDRVKRVEWTLQAQIEPDTRVRTLTSGASFTGRGEIATGEGDIVTPLKPLLCLSLRGAGLPGSCDGVAPLVPEATGKVEGKDYPVLQWADPTPTVTSSWTVWRISNPEGVGDGDPGRASWTEAAWIGDPTHTWFVDTSIPDGHTVQYVVRANTATGVGPESNQVVTGRRPAPPTITADGAATSITVDWDRPTGATGYDVFRDGALVRTISSGTTTSWTDTRDYGHAHTYQVVAVNRWENRLTRGGDDARVAAGSSVDATYTGGKRLPSNTTAAFTAPQAPGLTVTPNTSWANVVAWSPAGWTGDGPATVTGEGHRDRGWETRTHRSGDTWANLWTGSGEVPRGTTSKSHTSRTAGATDWYQARTCNTSGCSPWSATRTALQRPPAPTCTTSATTTPTRSMAVTVHPKPIEGTYLRHRLTGGTGSPTGAGEISGTTWTVDRLTHSRTHTFTVASRNASPANGGWSANTTCTGTTATLAVSLGAVTTMPVPTHQAGVTVATTPNPTGSNGVTSTTTLAGVSGAVNGTVRWWSGLTHNRSYVVTSVLSDGWQSVDASRTVSTDRLPAPGRPATPSCSYAAVTTDAPGALTINTVSGSARYRVDGGAWTTGRSWSGLAVGSHQGQVYRLGTSNTDGYNTVWGPDSYVGACPTVTVVQPWITGGATPGAPSGTCAAYLGAGAVRDGLNASVGSTGGTYLGFSITTSVSGSAAADSGSLVSGSQAGGDLRCTFFRAHHIVNSFGFPVGEWVASTLWTMGGGGAV